MSKIYDIQNMQVTQTEITFELSGHEVHVSLHQTGSILLPHARAEYLQIYDIDEDGLGIHWPVLDEDLSTEGLLRSAGRQDLIMREIPSLYLDEAVPATLAMGDYS